MSDAEVGVWLHSKKSIIFPLFEIQSARLKGWVGWKEKKTGKRNTVKVIIVIKVKCIGGLNIQNMIRFG